jgi:dihydroorotate dehydrogenase
VNLYPLFRFLLFRLDPELAHRFTLSLMRLVGAVSPLGAFFSRVYSAPQRPVEVFGLQFRNPIGLAAGYDKDGLAWRGLACLGFGHIEVGTVTPRPQLGNPRPRLFRLPQEQALINRMGFPGMGAEFVLRRISRPRPPGLVLGVNIGKNKATALESATQDYLTLLRQFSDKADYLAVNVSSPNTVGLRQLQEHHALDRLLNQLALERAYASVKPPILVKLAPDLTDVQLDDALDVILANHMDGVIATNTTLSREGIPSPIARQEGGLSGKPLFGMSLTMVKKISARTQGKLPIIGVGGLNNAAGVQKMLDAGAVLVQIYTGLVYEGPGLVQSILRKISHTPIMA